MGKGVKGQPITDAELQAILNGDSVPLQKNGEDIQAILNSDSVPVVNSESGSFPVKNANQKSNDYIDTVKRNNYSFAGDVINDMLNSRPAKELPRTSISDNISAGMMQYRPPVKANDLNIVDAKKSVKDKFNGDISTLVSFAEKYKDQLAGIPMTRGTNQEQGVVTNMADMLANPVPGTANTFGAAAAKPMFDAEKLSNRLANLKGDASAVAPFIDAGVKILNDEKNQKIKQLSTTYPMPAAHGIMNDIAPVEQRDPAYEEGVSAINAEYNKKESELRNAANSVVMTKLARERPDLGPEELGMKVREAIGDKTIATSNRLISKGIPLSAAERYASTSLGYQAKNIGKMSAYADGDIAVADKLAKETDDFHNKALNANPEYKQEQIKSAIKEQIYKNKPAYTALTGYSVSQDDFDKAVTQLELDPAELSGLTPEDIQSGASAPRRFMSSFIKNTAEGAYKTAIGGLSRLSGNDEDWTNKALNDHSNWYENSFAGSGYTGEDGKLFGDGVKIETARGDNYLENVKDESAKGFNPSFRSVLNTVFDATGQVAANAFGAGVLGGGTKGLMAAIALSQYENNYQQAVQAIGDDPNDQSKRHLYAALNTTATAFAETIMPDSDIVGGILGQGNIAGREFIDLIQREGVDAIRQPATRTLIAQGLKESFKQYGKEVSEDVIEQGVNSIVDAFLAPKKFAETDQSEAFKQTVISSAIGSAIPTFSSGMRAPIQKSRLINSMLYEVGSDPKTYIDNINELVEAGQINKAEGDDKIKTIERMAEIVNKSVPAKSVVNSQPLTDQQKEDYATNLLTENQLQEQREQVKDEVQESVIDAQIQNLQTERVEILNNAGPVIAENNSSSINNNGNETEKANEAQGQENGLLAPSESSAQGAAPASSFGGLEGFTGDDDTFSDDNADSEEVLSDANSPTTMSKTSPAVADIGVLPAPVQNENVATALPSEGDITLQNIAPRAVPTPVNYTTQTGNQTVTSQNGVFKVINSKTGEEVSKPTARKATIEAAQNYDFTVGDTSALPDLPMSGRTMATHVAETSTSPIELVDLYTNEEPEGETLSGPESAIVEYGGFSTTNKSYKRFGDKNNMGFSKAKSYINDAKGAGIDQIAQEVTDNTGIQVEPQDIVEFMDRFPNGVAQAMKTKPSPVAEKAAKRFQEITGFPLTADIADEVRKQADAKADQQEQDFNNNEYATRTEIENELWDEAARQLLATEPAESIISYLVQATEDVTATSEGQAADTGGTTGASQEVAGSGTQDSRAGSSGDNAGELSIDDRLLAMRDEIGAMRDKLERSVAARDLLQKQGKVNTPEYQVKFKGAQQLNQKLKTLQREYEKMSSKAWAEILRSKKVATRTDEESFVERNDIPVEELNFNPKSEYYQQLDEALKEVKEARSGVTRTKRSSIKSAKTVNDFTRKLLAGATDEDITQSKAGLSDAIANYKEEKRSLRAALPRERGANFLIEKLSAAARNENIPQESADLAIDLVRANPDIFSDLAISITTPGDNDPQGFYSSAPRLIKIFKGSDVITATHELLHHTERFLPLDIREGILAEWDKNLGKEKSAIRAKLEQRLSPQEWVKNYKTLLFLEMAQKRQSEASANERNVLSKEMFTLLKDVGSDRLYQFFNPSEWWAVNASEQFQKKQVKAEGWIAKAKQWYRKLLTSAKNILGLNSTQAVSKGLSAVLNGKNLDTMVGSQLGGAGVLYNASTPVGINANVYNAAIEKAASALERGDSKESATQQAIDFIKDRVHGKWDENKMRNDILGEDMSVPLNPEEIRARKISDGQLSAKQQKGADAMISAIKQNKETLTSAETYINTHKNITPDTKAKVISYLRSTVSRDVFKATAMIEAQDYINNADGDYNEALRQLQLDYAQNTLNNTDEKLLENLRAQYVATQTEIESQQSEAAVKDGTIKPVSVTEKSAPVPEGGFVMPEQKKSNELRQNLANRYESLELAQKNSTVAITEQLDAVTAYRLMNDRAAYAINEIKDYLGDTNNKKGSFFNRLYKSGIDVQSFALYLYAKHAPERNAQNALARKAKYDARLYELNQQLASNLTDKKRQEVDAAKERVLAQQDRNYVLMPDGGSGMTNAQAEEILAEIEANGETEKYDQFGQEFRENVIDKILDYKHEAGLLKDQEYENLSSTYSHYVPLKFDMDEALGSDGSKSLAETGKTGRDLFRSTGAAEIGYESRNNVILQTVSDLEYSIQQAEENRANIRMANLVEVNSNDNVWETKPARYDVLKDKNGNVVDAVEVFKPQGKGVIPYWVDGGKRYIVLHDKGLQDTFKRFEPNMVLRAGQNTSSFIRTYSTLTNPVFLALNPIKDMQDALVYVSGQSNPKFTKAFTANSKNFFGVASGIFLAKGEWNELKKEWESIGGKTSFSKTETINEKGRKSIKNFKTYEKGINRQNLLPKVVGNTKALKNAISTYAEVFEQTTRLIVYKSALDAGMTKEHAAIQSREATVDFGKSGVYGPLINPWKAFANAGIQGVTSVWALRKSKAFQRLIGYTALFGFAQAAFADMFSDCEEHPESCYWEMPEYEKQGNIVIATGVGAPAKIPLGRRLGWVNYMGQQAYALGKYYLTDGEHGTSPEDFFKNSVTSFFNYYDPTGQVSNFDFSTLKDATVSATRLAVGNFAPAIELIANKNNFGGRIKPENNTNKPESENYLPNTPEAYKDFAHFLAKISGGGNGEKGIVEMSPNDMDFIMQSTFSGLYSFIKGTATAVSKGSNTDEKLKAKDVPFVNRFYRELNLSGTKDKLNNIVEKSKDKELSEGEMDKMHHYISRLKDNGELTEEQVASKLKFVNKEQKRILKAKNKAAEEDSEE